MREHVDDSGPSWMFWALAPFLVLCFLFPLLIDQWAPVTVITVAGMEVLLVLVFLGFLNPVVFHWAWRGVGGLIFTLFAAYLVTAVVQSVGSPVLGRSGGPITVLSATMGMLVFGLPGLWFALFGRLTLRRTDDASADRWQELWDARLSSLESIFGPSDDGVFHSPLPFHLGGAADVVPFRRHLDGVTYVTADLIGDTRSKPNQLGQYELMICLREHSDWGPELISNLATYTLEAVLEPTETMDVAPSLPQPTQITSLLFVAYSELEFEAKPCGVLLCLGITEDELRYRHECGYDQVVEALKSAGVFPFTDLCRQSVLANGQDA